MPDHLTVTAPASSANLGPGFDCLALALELRNEVVVEPGAAGVEVIASGEGAGEAGSGADNLFVRAFAAGGGDPSGLRFTMTNRVPFSRGLGSSAATIAAGLVAGAAWSGADEADLLTEAAAIEGHPDNVAAALNGGLTLAWGGPDGPRAIGFDPPDLGFVVVVPEHRLSTAAARAALPATVPHGDAVHTAARAALLVAALAAGDGELLREALDDRLHEPYRASLVPQLAETRERLRDVEAVVGVTLSGAGPSVLIWHEPEAEESVLEALGDLADARALPLEPAVEGVTVDLG